MDNCERFIESLENQLHDASEWLEQAHKDIEQAEAERDWLAGVLHNSTGIVDGKKYDVTKSTWLIMAEQAIAQSGKEKP